ncbi:hypothetical protein [Nocardia brasiliensis]|uniref:hypothetical protein n=1 Tax=Nocardia brasiliensis TaxID=37326 RepID=UPI0004A6B8D6|nr:hypothetical protein [Nocardia brasiliensis]
MIDLLYAAVVVVVVLTPAAAAFVVTHRNGPDSPSRRTARRILDIYNLDGAPERVYSVPLLWAIMAILIAAALAFVAWGSPIPLGIRAGVLFATLSVAPQVVTYMISQKGTR